MGRYRDHDMTAAQYQQRFTECSGQGFCVTDISGYTLNNQPRFIAIWTK